MDSSVSDPFSHVETLTSIDEIRDALAKIETEEGKVEGRLNELIGMEPELDKEMKKIQTAIPTIEALETSSRLKCLLMDD